MRICPHEAIVGHNWQRKFAPCSGWIIVALAGPCFIMYNDDEGHAGRAKEGEPGRARCEFRNVDDPVRGFAA